ncbi:glycine-rich domain-containing protein [Streptomyces sp. NPDC014779]|uniref:glycine-rich domain-containing protein n=1 Tax=Streptomyces sp. NPDC014779 TaxID=3364911 RepID=UPI0036F9FE48
MTVAPERPVALRRGQDLVAPELFDRLAAFCAEEYGLDPATAVRVMNEGLAFLWTMGTTGKGAVMAPSRDVDPAWHTFMLHSQEYAAWCEEHFGRFLHHAPNSKTRSGGLMLDVMELMHGAGFAVDRSLWGFTADCNEPACCGDGPCC